MSAGKLVMGGKRTRSAMLVVEFAAGPDLMMTETGSKRRAAAWLLHPDVLAAELAHIGPGPLDPAFTVEALRARASNRVESSGGSGESSGITSRGISVHPSTTASQPSSLNSRMTSM
jgi:hypothetical protein